MLFVPAVSQAAPAPQLAWTPSGSFGTLDVGAAQAQTSKTITFMLANSGGAASGALSVSLTGSSPFKVTSNTCNGISLGPGKKCMVTVKYTQTVAGQSNTAVLTAVAARPAVTAKTTLTGATGSPSLAWSQSGMTLTSYDYQTVDGVGGQTKSETFTLTNAGSGSTGSLAASSPTGSSAFSVTNDGCKGVNLSPSAPTNSCAVTVQYAPTSSGESDSGTLTTGGANLDLSGSGGTPSLALSPTTGTGAYEFGTVSTEDTVTQTFTLTNSGSGTTPPLGASVVANAMANVNASGFFVASMGDGCQGVSLSPTSSGNSCTVTVAYNPTVQGSLDSDNATLSAGAASLNLSGNGGNLAWELGPGNTITSHDFGSVPVGNTVQDDFTLINLGTFSTSPLAPSFTTTDDNAEWFADFNGCQGTSLAPSGTCGVLGFMYTPEVYGNSDSSTMSADGQSLSLTGTGGPSAVTLSSNPGATSDGLNTEGTQTYSLELPQVGLGGTADASLTFTNSGPGTTEHFEFKGGSNPPFDVTHNGCSSGTTLHPSDSCTVDIQYTAPSTCTSDTEDSTRLDLINAADLVDVTVTPDVTDCGP
jgi:hypothetical protein